MRKHRFSVRLRDTGREVATADDREGAEMAIQTLVTEGLAKRSTQYRKAADFAIFDNLTSHRQAMIGDLKVYVTEETADGGFVAVDAPFAKPADQTKFLLGEDGMAYLEPVGSIGPWEPLWQYARDIR